ncbi:hypothetical protein SOVF_013710, partial [Spinacia oleracea]
MVQELQRKLIEQEKKLEMREQKKMVEKEMEDKEKNSIEDPEKQEEHEKDEDEVKVPEGQEEPERKDEADGTNTETVPMLQNEMKKDGQEAGEEPQKSKGKSKKTVPNRKRTREVQKVNKLLLLMRSWRIWMMRKKMLWLLPNQKAEERKLNLRQTPQLMMRFLKGIASDEDAHVSKQQAITELGFGSLLQLDIPQNESPFPYELVQNFNSSDQTLNLGKSSLDITIEDVYLVYGSPVTHLGDDKDMPQQQAHPSEEAKVPSTIEKGKSTQEEQEGRNTEENGSILSQDKEFFSSDYFIILFDEVVRKATVGNERKETEESKDVSLDLPPFLTPLNMPSQPNVFGDLTLKLGMASASNPPPQAHDYEEEMNLEAILANKTLTQRDLETISGDNKDDADKEQPPTEKT